VLSIPCLGFLNFHPSLLPYNRGKNPNFWSLIEETTFGVTIHWVDDEVDHGDIAFQKQIDKGWEDTGESLYRKALTEIVRLFVDSYPGIRQGEIPRIPQDHGLATFHRASELELASRLDLDDDSRVRDLLNRLRARTFPPHPACWFVDDGERYEVRISITKVENENNG
jgi:methionyl-tRNA formyltransferase